METHHLAGSCMQNPGLSGSSREGTEAGKRQSQGWRKLSSPTPPQGPSCTGPSTPGDPCAMRQGQPEPAGCSQYTPVQFNHTPRLTPAPPDQLEHQQGRQRPATAPWIPKQPSAPQATLPEVTCISLSHVLLLARQWQRHLELILDLFGLAAPRR